MGTTPLNSLTEAEVWDLVLQNERLLRREVKRYVPRHRLHEMDDIYGDVVLARAHKIMRTYDPKRGVLPITHLCACVRWYAYERVLGRKYKKVPDTVDAEQLDRVHSSALAESARHEVNELLASLPEDAALLLEWHLAKGYTFEEIAGHLEVTRAQAKTQYREAFELARGVGVYRRMTRWLEAVLDEETRDDAQRRTDDYTGQSPGRGYGR